MLSTFLFISLLVSSSTTLPLDEFFPYGPRVGDLTISSNDDESVGPLPLPYIFPYFDNNHRQIWVANNGLFSFLSSINAYVPNPFPLANDSRLVAGFWTDIDTTGLLNETGNKVYYQIYRNTLLSNITLLVFNKTKNYVGRFFTQQHVFEPTMIITATWYRVGAYPRQTSELNTFQIVLSTDGDRSFVFFLYHDLQWANPPNNLNSYAQAGFNAGDGLAFKMLPHSRTKNIIQLVNESNVNIPGLFAFRVDTDQIHAGGCADNVTIASFRPRTSSQFGLTALNIHGPCFTNQTIINCRFGSSSEVVNGIVIDQFRAICLTPFASEHGRVPIRISINNEQAHISMGTLTYAPLKFGSDEVNIETEDGDKLISFGQYVKLTWHFSQTARDTFPIGTKLDIQLWKVSLNQESELIKDDQLIILAQNLDLIDSMRVHLHSIISDISTCFIRVVAHFNTEIYGGLNTGLLIVRIHPSLAPELCQRWVDQQPEPSTWNGDGDRDDLLLCPMTRSQVVASNRCCYQSDRQCYRDSPSPHNCWLHQSRSGHDEPSVVECYLSIISNRHGAGAECCYDQNGTIITRGTGAGTDDRYHPTTSPVKHFFHDILPYLQCCLMSTNVEACNKYMHYRPPRRGSNTMGESGGMWGDPHFVTLDGTSYTFNGHGEYTYFAINNGSLPLAHFNETGQSFIFMSQIRTAPLPSSNATVTKGFAARSFDVQSESVSLTISRREQIILRRGNETLEFEENINTLFFPELTINRLDGNNNNSHFSLSWIIGINIEISVIKMTLPDEQLALNVGASVAERFRNKTSGLLGTYDGITSNDLRSIDGKVISSNASLEQIHKEFGISWSIDPSTSLFSYESGQSAKFFYDRNRDFVPSFIDPTNSTADNSSIRVACKINATSSPRSWNIGERSCYYDLSMTNDISFAQGSLKSGNELLLIKTNQRNLPTFNVSLPVTMNLIEGDRVYLIISASGENPTNIVVLSAVHLPFNGVFNETSGDFEWTAILGEDYVSIEAFDQTDDSKSRHEITFSVKSVEETTVDLDNGTTLIINSSTINSNNGTTLVTSSSSISSSNGTTTTRNSSTVGPSSRCKSQFNGGIFLSVSVGLISLIFH